MNGTTIFLEIIQEALECDNAKEAAVKIQKIYNLEYSSENLRKMFGGLKKLAEQLDVHPTKLGLTLTKSILDKDGNVAKEVYAKRDKLNIDLSKFELKKASIANFGVQWATFEKKGFDYDRILDKLNEKYKDFTPPVFEPTYKGQKENCAIINLYDAHLDKIAIKGQVGYDSSLSDNIHRFKKAFALILDDIKERKSEKIILPVGNDLFHTNGFNNKTKKGTELDYYCDPETAYCAICDCIIDCVYMAAQVAPVEVEGVKGNHDADKIIGLMYWLSKLFCNSDSVKVKNNRKQDTCNVYGECMFVFGHGDKEKKKIQQLPSIMAVRYPQQWAKTKLRKYLCGDLHHGFEYQFLKAKDTIGMTVEFLRSIGVDDRYHYDHGWIGVPKSAYVSYYEKDGMRESKEVFNF